MDVRWTVGRRDGRNLSKQLFCTRLRICIVIFVMLDVNDHFGFNFRLAAIKLYDRWTSDMTVYIGFTFVEMICNLSSFLDLYIYLWFSFLISNHPTSNKHHLDLEPLDSSVGLVGWLRLFLFSKIWKFLILFNLLYVTENYTYSLEVIDGQP